MNDESLERVQRLGQQAYVDSHGHEQPYLTPYEVANLSIRRGTLNDDEWENMRSHATFSENYLERIPWSSAQAPGSRKDSARPPPRDNAILAQGCPDFWEGGFAKRPDASQRA